MATDDFSFSATAAAFAGGGWGGSGGVYSPARILGKSAAGAQSSGWFTAEQVSHDLGWVSVHDDHFVTLSGQNIQLVKQTQNLDVNLVALGIARLQTTGLAAF